VKPAWIYDVLLLWRRRQLLALLLEQASDYTEGDIPDARVRRAILSTIATHFVDTRSVGKQAVTLTQNVWATYSRNFPVEVLAPAFLAHWVAEQPLAYALATQWVGRCVPGATLDPQEYRPLLEQCPDGGRPAALDALLRTLQHFGVLAPRRRAGQYVVAEPLPIAGPLFPLLVWDWWLLERSETVDLGAFARAPLFAFIDSADFAAGWEAHEGRLWTLGHGAEGMTAQLRPADRAAWRRALLNLLSKQGRRRNLPRASEPPQRPQASQAGA
jgi:hypothetical protein